MNRFMIYRETYFDGSWLIFIGRYSCCVTLQHTPRGLWSIHFIRGGKIRFWHSR